MGHNKRVATSDSRDIHPATPPFRTSLHLDHSYPALCISYCHTNHTCNHLAPPTSYSGGRCLLHLHYTYTCVPSEYTLTVT